MWKCSLAIYQKLSISTCWTKKVHFYIWTLNYSSTYKIENLKQVLGKPLLHFGRIFQNRTFKLLIPSIKFWSIPNTVFALFQLKAIISNLF